MVVVTASLCYRTRVVGVSNNIDFVSTEPPSQVVMSLVLKDELLEPRYAHLCREIECVIATYIV